MLALTSSRMTLSLPLLVALAVSWTALTTITVVKADSYLPVSNDRYDAKPASYTKRIALTTPEEWLAEFNFDTQQNAYHQYVNFVDEEQAKQLGMIGAGIGGKGFRWGFDVGQSSSSGKRSLSSNATNNEGELNRRAFKRNSLRFKSKNWYKDGVYIFSINKVPVGCSVWSSIFTQSSDEGAKWRSEIDIFEYANGYNRPNAIVLHSQGVCTKSEEEVSSLVDGDALMTTCTKRIGVSGRRGCGIYMDHSGNPNAASIPEMMNKQPTIIAVERSQAAVNAWFWTKAEAPTVLQDVASQTSINTGSFGKATLSLPPFRACTDSKQLDTEHVIVMMLDQCAGLPEFYWAKDSCNKKTGMSCPAYHNTGAATKELLENGGGHFDFESFVFFAPAGQTGGPQSNSPESTTSSSSSTSGNPSTSGDTDHGSGSGSGSGSKVKVSLSSGSPVSSESTENQHSFVAGKTKGHGHKVVSSSSSHQFKAAAPAAHHHGHAKSHSHPHVNHAKAHGHFHTHHRPSLPRDHEQDNEVDARVNDDGRNEERDAKSAKFSGDELDAGRASGRGFFDHLWPHAEF